MGSEHDVFTTRIFYSNNIVIFFVIYFIRLGQTLEWSLRTTTDTLKKKEYLTNYILGVCKWLPLYYYLR